MLNNIKVRAQIHEALLTSEICDQSRVKHIGDYLVLYNKTNRCTNFPAGMELAGPAWKLSPNRMTYTSAKSTLNVILMMGRGTVRNMYRFISSQNKFGKLVHLMVLL